MSIAVTGLSSTEPSQSTAGMASNPRQGAVVPLPLDTQLPPLALGLTLSPAMSPIPHRIVQRIQAGRFVEMRELLTDNLALHNQLEAVQGLPGLVSKPTTLSVLFCLFYLSLSNIIMVETSVKMVHVRGIHFNRSEDSSSRR